MSVRLGVANGLVVVGDLIGAGAAQERGVVGETPNLAPRLQALARPGTLVISESTRRQIGALFEIQDLGPQPLAGFAEPQRAWRVTGESGIVNRFEALRSEATRLVGRDEELDLLLQRWQLEAAREAGIRVMFRGSWLSIARPFAAEIRATLAVAAPLASRQPGADGDASDQRRDGRASRRRTASRGRARQRTLNATLLMTSQGLLTAVAPLAAHSIGAGEYHPAAGRVAGGGLIVATVVAARR